MRICALIICLAAISCAPPATRVNVQFVAPCDQEDLLTDLSELRIGERVFHLRDAQVGSLPEQALANEKSLLIQGSTPKGPLIARIGSPAFALRTDSNEPARVLLAAPNEFVSAGSRNGRCLTIQGDDANVSLLGYSVSYVPNVNKVLIVGGVLRAPGQEDKYLNSVQSYDPDTGMFTTLPSLKISRAFHTSSASATGKVLLAGGKGEILNQVKEIRPGVIIDMNASPAFYDEAIMLLPRAFHRATTLNLMGTKVALTGGCTNGCDLSRDTLHFESESFRNASTAIEIIDLDTKTRVVKEHALNQGRVLHGASVIRDRFIVVSGGVGESGILSSIEVFDLQKEATVKDLYTNKLEKPLAQHAQITDNDKNSVLLIGGNTVYENSKLSAPSDVIARWDPNKGEHAFGLRLQKSRAPQQEIVMSDGSVMLLGGSDKDAFAERIMLNATYPSSELLNSNFETSAYALSALAIPSNRAMLVLGTQGPHASQIKMLTLK